MALETGSDLVPVYAFGESELYSHSKLFLKERLWIAHRYKAAVVFLYGRWGIVPHRPTLGITMAFASPIGIAEVNKSPNYKTFERGEKGTKGEVSQEEVDHWHGVYIQRLKALFNDNKKELGFGDRELELF